MFILGNQLAIIQERAHNVIMPRKIDRRRHIGQLAAATTADSRVGERQNQITQPQHNSGLEDGSIPAL
jgi:hypothetical protein